MDGKLGSDDGTAAAPSGGRSSGVNLMAVCANGHLIPAPDVFLAERSLPSMQDRILSAVGPTFVYEAEFKLTDSAEWRRVAVKVDRRCQSACASQLRRADVPNSEHIAQTLAVVTGAVPALVMELVPDSCSLFWCLHPSAHSDVGERPPSTRFTLSRLDRYSLAVEICQGLEDLHGRNRAHKQLRSDRVLVWRNKEDHKLHAKITAVGCDESHLMSTIDLVTDAGPNMWTDPKALFLPMAVEEQKSTARTEPGDAAEDGNRERLWQRFDVYSLGMVLLELFTGRFPWEDDPVWPIKHQQQRDPPIHLPPDILESALCSDHRELSRLTRQVLERCWSCVPSPELELGEASRSVLPVLSRDRDSKGPRPTAEELKQVLQRLLDIATDATRCQRCQSANGTN